MADKKISQLTALTGANAATDDQLAIVDTNAAETKKISREEFFKNTPNIGIGTSSPSAKLEVNGDVILGAEVYRNSDVSYMRIAGGNPGASGATVIAFGASHATAPGRLTLSAVGAGSIIFGTNASERMRIDSSGNLGLGVTPSAWDRPAYQSTQNLALVGLSNTSNLAQNAYFNAGWKYMTTAASALSQVGQGAHYWFTAPSGTAGNAITFTQAMTLDASGNLILGQTSSTYGKFAVSNGTNQFTVGFTSNTPIMTAVNAAGNGYADYIADASSHQFRTASSEQMRLTSTGLGIGTSSPAQKLDVDGIVLSKPAIGTNSVVGGASSASTTREIYGVFASSSAKGSWAVAGATGGVQAISFRTGSDNDYLVWDLILQNSPQIVCNLVANNARDVTSRSISSEYSIDGGSTWVALGSATFGAGNGSFGGTISFSAPNRTIYLKVRCFWTSGAINSDLVGIRTVLFTPTCSSVQWAKVLG